MSKKYPFIELTNKINMLAMANALKRKKGKFPLYIRIGENDLGQIATCDLSFIVNCPKLNFILHKNETEKITITDSYLSKLVLSGEF